jgi:hypothetical protein
MLRRGRPLMDIVGDLDEMARSFAPAPEGGEQVAQDAGDLR